MAETAVLVEDASVVLQNDRRIAALELEIGILRAEVVALRSELARLQRPVHDAATETDEQRMRRYRRALELIDDWSQEVQVAAPATGSDDRRAAS